MQVSPDLYFNVTFEQAKSLLSSEEYSTKSALIRSHPASQDRFTIVKRFPNGAVDEFPFRQKTKEGKLFYMGYSCTQDISYRVICYSARSLRTYIQSLSLRDRLSRAHEEVACYVDNLFAEELGLFLFHGSYLEANRYLTSSKKKLVVRPNPRDPLSFFVHMKFAQNVCKGFFFKVSKSKSHASSSGFKIKGHSISRFHTRPLTFYSAHTFQKYLETAKRRAYFSKESEELATGIDTLFCKHVMDVNGSEHALLKPINHMPRQVSITRKNDQGQKYESVFQVIKKQSVITLTGPAGQLVTSGSLTLCSLKASRIYLANVGAREPKAKVSRVYSQSEIEFILSMNSLNTERRKLRVDECDSPVGSPVSHPANDHRAL